MEFYNDPVNVDEYEKMCDEYDGSELYEVLEKHLIRSSTLLELGSGLGLDINHLQKSYSVTGSDMSDEFILRYKKKNTSIPFLKLDAVSINTDKKYDCLFSNKVLHHLTLGKLKKSFEQQQKVIQKDGIFAHTFWLGDKEFTMKGMLFLFHDREKLLDLVSKYFTIIEAYDYTEFDDGDSIFILAKNDKAHLRK